MAPVEEAVTRMQAWVDEIRTIELRIQRIALNAEHTGHPFGEGGGCTGSDRRRDAPSCGGFE